MTTLENLRSLMSLDEAVEYFKDVQLVPKEVIEEIRKRLKGSDLEAISGQEANNLYYKQLNTMVSMQGRDIIDSEMKNWLESYDKKMDLAVLQATDIVSAYNSLVEGQFDKLQETAKKYVDKLTSMGVTKLGFGFNAASVKWVDGNIEKLTNEYGMTEQDAKKHIMGQLFEQTEDPNRIREILKARLNYNKTMTTILQDMLKANYRILGMTEDMMRAFVEGMDSDDADIRSNSIKMARSTFVNEMNNGKYKKDGYYDYRPLGAGVLCITVKDLGDLEEWRENKSILAQKVLAYDIVIFGHGDSKKLDPSIAKKKEELDKAYKDLVEESNKRAKEIAKINAEKMNPYLYKCKKILTRIEHRANMCIKATNRAFELNYSGRMSDEKLNRILVKLSKRETMLDSLMSDIRKAVDDFVKKTTDDTYKQIDADEKINQLDTKADAILKDLTKFNLENDNSDNAEWTIQEVKTPAGTFTKVVPMVEALIKKGFKKIYLLSCNPGHHKLPKSITERKDVTVAMGRNTVIAETQDYVNNSQPGDILHESACDIVDADAAIRSYCESIGVDYDDDIALFEAYCEVDDELNYQDFTMNEASGSIWRRLWETAKKVVKAVIWFFKKIIQMCATLVKKIIDRFRKKGKKKLSRKISIKLPIVENATIKEISGDSYEDISRAAAANVQRITKAIKEQERKQNDNLQKYEQYTGKMANSSSTNESITLASLRNML